MVVDGSPGPGTVLTLSHWPAGPTPSSLAADLSAEIAFRYLAEPGRWPRPGLVSNDHLDQDGLVSLFAMTRPDEAVARSGFLVEVARAGDFASFSDRRAGLVSFALATMADPERSPLPGESFPDAYAERCAALHTELLGRLPALMDHPEAHRHLWAEESASLQASERALASGRVTIEERPQLDLAVVRAAEEMAPALATRFVSRGQAVVHPAAVHNSTAALRVLTVQGRRYELRYRYESWVKLVSRRPLPRVDLVPLAGILDGEEPGRARWRAGAAGALEPVLSLRDGEESGLAPDRVTDLVERHLASAPSAWDPYAASAHRPEPLGEPVEQPEGAPGGGGDMVPPPAISEGEGPRGETSG